MANGRNNAFYRTTYTSLFFVLIVAIFLMLTMVIVVLYQLFHRPLPEFRALSADNKVLTLTAFDEPNTMPSTLLRWASKAAVAAYTFDFVNYNQQTHAASPYFTEIGWRDYQNSVARLIQDIKGKQLFVNGVVASPPVISNQGYLPGKGYIWRVQMPFLVTYQSAESTSRERYMVLMTVTKIPTTVDPTGIGIDQFVMR